mmetsp:Transcript_24997/g.54361  ORF Transcript_24997/g.54361 Transcript_24997/m.54361 type:complete len:369 (-) Transcript_24997:268-1374(-)
MARNNAEAQARTSAKQKKTKGTKAKLTQDSFRPENIGARSGQKQDLGCTTTNLPPTSAAALFRRAYMQVCFSTAQLLLQSHDLPWGSFKARPVTSSWSLLDKEGGRTSACSDHEQLALVAAPLGGKTRCPFECGPGRRWHLIILLVIVVKLERDDHLVADGRVEFVLQFLQQLGCLDVFGLAGEFVGRVLHMLFNEAAEGDDRNIEKVDDAVVGRDLVHVPVDHFAHHVGMEVEDQAPGGIDKGDVGVGCSEVDADACVSVRQDVKAKLLPQTRRASPKHVQTTFDQGAGVDLELGIDLRVRKDGETLPGHVRKTKAECAAVFHRAAGLRVLNPDPVQAVVVDLLVWKRGIEVNVANVDGDREVGLPE